jgi:hypothetical protein
MGVFFCFVSVPNVAELKQSYDQANSNERTLPEHFREPVHLKPGPPYQHETTSKQQQQQQQEHHDPLDQNIWHPLTQTVTEPTFIPIPPKSDLPQQQLLEPRVADNQEQHFPIYSGITPILDVSQLQSKETDCKFSIISFRSNFKFLLNVRLPESSCSFGFVPEEDLSASRQTGNSRYLSPTTCDAQQLLSPTDWADSRGFQSDILGHRPDRLVLGCSGSIRIGIRSDFQHGSGDSSTAATTTRREQQQQQ